MNIIEGERLSLVYVSNFRRQADAIKLLLARRVTSPFTVAFRAYTTPDADDLTSNSIRCYRTFGVGGFPFDGFVENKKVALWGKQNGFPVTAWVREADNTAVLTLEEGRDILPIIPVVLPGLFRDEPLTDEEKKLIEERDDETAYTANCTALYNAVYRDEHIAVVVSKTAEAGVRSRQNNLNSALSDLYSTIRDIDERRRDIMKRIRDTRDQLAGLLTTKPQDMTGLASFLGRNTVIDDLRLHEDDYTSYLYFVVKKTVDMFDPALAERMYQQPPEYWYYECPEWSRPLFKALFVDCVIKVKVMTSFSVSLSTFSVRLLEDGVQYERDPGYLVNPHHKHYNCIGDFGDAFSEAAESGDLVKIMSLASASAGCLNLAESITMEHFFHDVFRTPNERIFILPDGREATVSEAMVWLSSTE